MRDQINLEPLLDALAERVAAKLGTRLTENSGSAAIQPRLLNVQQAARYIGRTKEAVQHLVADGTVPVVRHDRRVFLDIRDLDRWIERHKSGV
jgi:excisionase family DNA binding protein